MSNADDTRAVRAVHHHFTAFGTNPRRSDPWELDAAMEDTVMGAEQSASIVDSSRVKWGTASAQFQMEFMHRLARCNVRSNPAWVEDAGAGGPKAQWCHGYIAEHLAKFADPTGPSGCR